MVENERAGTRAWLGPEAPGGAIEGYGSEITVAPRAELRFHVSTRPAARYRIEIFRLGWYGGLGGRLMACLPGCRTDEPGVPRPVPPVPSDPAAPVRAGWPVTDVLHVGAGWVSGYYEARFLLTSGANLGSGSVTYFIVRAAATRHARILVQVPVNTWEAYNTWGGRSLYSGPGGPGYRVSFDRPFAADKQSPLAWEIQLVRYLERGRYDVSYQTDLDTDRDPSSLLRNRLVMSVGHDEYWTKRIRDAFERARDSGVNLAFMGANVGFWQMRYEDGGRTIVEYRVSQRDPEPDPAQKTVMFRRLTPPRPECELRGVNWWGGIGPAHDYKVEAGSISDPWFRHTGLTATTVLRGLVGYEWDFADPSCNVPAPVVLFEWKGAPTSAEAVRYRAPSGAIVFSAGSLQFSWGLDGFGNRARVAADPRLQRFMHNALHDLLRKQRPPPSPANSSKAILLPVVRMPRGASAIVGENRLLGSRHWLLPLAHERRIEGYASQTSVAPGETLDLHVSTTPSARYRIVVYRLGWYHGRGARRVACLPSCRGAAQGVPQLVPTPDPVTGQIRAAWPVTERVQTTRRWTSGYYIAELLLVTGVGARSANLVPFVVRQPPSGRPSRILIVAPVNTWQAYNSWGGKSLYGSWLAGTSPKDYARAVSFDRPYDSLTSRMLLYWEYPLLRFLERNGFDVSYETDVDLARDPAEPLRHRLVIIPGHSEYWTREMRDALENARNAGVNLAFIGGNDGYWQARYADQGRTLLEYRSFPLDPSADEATKTVRFRDLHPPRPECTLVGVEWQGGGDDPAPQTLRVNDAALSDPWFRNTGFTPGSTLENLAGYEWDAIEPACPVPTLTQLFHYQGKAAPHSRPPFESSYYSTNADVVRYTAPSGARVFATGSIQFSWGLDNFAHTLTTRNPLLADPVPPDPRLQRFMRNAFADLTAPTSHPNVSSRGGRPSASRSCAARNQAYGHKCRPESSCSCSPRSAAASRPKIIPGSLECSDD